MNCKERRWQDNSIILWRC